MESSVGRAIKVHLPQKQFTLEETNRLLGEILKLAGCGGCFSGRDFLFTHELDFSVNLAGKVIEGGGF
jgi:hypothetical protein